MGTKQAILRASGTLKVLHTEITSNPMAALNQGAKNKFSFLARNNLLPILASFINEDEKKAQFLALDRNDHFLYEFLVRNEAILSNLNNLDGDELKRNALVLLNQLLPDGLKLAWVDLTDPRTKAADSTVVVKNDLQLISLIAFLSSETCTNLFNDVLNPHDFALVHAYMSNFDHIKLLAEKIIAENVTSLNKDIILNLIKSSDPSLADIVTMDNRVKQFQEFVEELTAHKESSLDNKEMSSLVTDLITPVLFHPQFISVVDNAIGFLDEQEITLILAASLTEPAEKAKQVIQFLHLLRTKNKEEFARQFISLPDDATRFDIELLPAKKNIRYNKRFD